MVANCVAAKLISIVRTQILDQVSLAFLVLNARTDPYIKIFQSNFKISVDAAITLTFILSILLKVDLSREENISVGHVAVALLAVNVGLPMLCVLHQVCNGNLNLSGDETKLCSPS